MEQNNNLSLNQTPDVHHYHQMFMVPQMTVISEETQ